MGNLIPFHPPFAEIAERETRNFTFLGQRGVEDLRLLAEGFERRSNPTRTD